MPKSYGDVMQQNGVAVGEVPQSQVYGNGISGEYLSPSLPIPI